MKNHDSRFPLALLVFAPLSAWTLPGCFSEEGGTGEDTSMVGGEGGAGQMPTGTTTPQPVMTPSTPSTTQMPSPVPPSGPTGPTGPTGSSGAGGASGSSGGSGGASGGSGGASGGSGGASGGSGGASGGSGGASGGSGGASGGSGGAGGSGDEGVPPTFATLQYVIVAMGCDGADCHGGNEFNPLSLVVDDMLYANLTDTVSAKCENLPVVDPGNPEGSALVRLLKGPCGEIPQMPNGCTPGEGGGCLPDDYIAAIEQWVADGAPQ